MWPCLCIAEARNKLALTVYEPCKSQFRPVNSEARSAAFFDVERAVLAYLTFTNSPKYTHLQNYDRIR